MWRGEKGKVTTAEDIVRKYLEMSQGMEIHFPFYDWSCKDLDTVHWRITGKSLTKAVKDKEGYGFVDTLLKNNLLEFWGYEDEPYLDWIVSEFENLSNNTAKKDRLDELTDTVRYALAGVAHLFDLEDLKPRDPEQFKKQIEEIHKDPLDYGRRSLPPIEEDEDDGWIVDEDIKEWEDELNGF